MEMFCYSQLVFGIARYYQFTHYFPSTDRILNDNNLNGSIPDTIGTVQTLEVM
jgi:hypothetical protein